MASKQTRDPQVPTRRPGIYPTLATLLLSLLLTTLTLTTISANPTSSDPNWDGSSPTSISDTQHRSVQPQIIVDDSGHILAAWSYRLSATPAQKNMDIYVATSDSSGSTWSTPTVISTSARTSHHPSLLALNDDVFVAWVELNDAIYETEINSADPPRSVPCPLTAYDFQPQLVAGNGRLHLIFAAGAALPTNLYHTSRLSTDTSWPVATSIVTSNASLGAWWPAAAISPGGNLLHVVWEEKQSSTLEAIMYMSGTVSGPNVTWSTPLTLSTGIDLAFAPDIAVDEDGIVHIVFAESQADKTDQHVYYMQHDPNTGSWTPYTYVDDTPVQVNTESPTYIAPSIATWTGDNTTRVCVAWYGYRTGDPAKAEEILLHCSEDGGDTWTDSTTFNISQTTTEGEEVSLRPDIAFDAMGNLHIIWQERAGASLATDYDIYYSRSLIQVYLPLTMRSY